tara:strand:- start:4632 stop:5015 length:384 start_codon:yes stop_codon:yes gene_type:complete
LKLFQTTILVRDYDEAIAWYRDQMGFALIGDTALSPDKRWVVMSPGEGGAEILLARAAGGEEQAAIGNQAGGRVLVFLQTDDFETDYTRMKAAGVEFIEAPRDEAYGRVVVLRDLYGNLWDLIGAPV